MNRFSYHPVLFVVLCLISCNTQNSGTKLAVSSLTNHLDCNYKETKGKVMWIAKKSDLLAMHNSINRQSLGKTEPLPAEIDFQNYGVAAVFMGQKPTTGYSLALEKHEIDMHDQTADLHLIFNNPPVDQFPAQVMTSPCILIKVPKAGYSTIQITDQNGKLRYRVQLP